MHRTPQIPPPQGQGYRIWFSLMNNYSSPIIWGRWPDRAGGGQDEALRQGPPPPSGHLPHLMGEEFEKFIRDSPPLRAGTSRGAPTIHRYLHNLWRGALPAKSSDATTANRDVL